MPDDRICGLNAVSALFARRLDDVNRLFYGGRMKAAAGPLCALLARRRLPYRLLPADELERVAGTTHHGGIVAMATPRPMPALDPAHPPRHNLLLVLDGIGNPHNLGAIARSAAFFGVPAHCCCTTPPTRRSRPTPPIAWPRAGSNTSTSTEPAICRPRLRALDPHYRTVAATLGARRGAGARLAAGPAGGARAGQRGARPAAGGRWPPAAAGSASTARGPVQSLNVAQAAAILLHELVPMRPRCASICRASPAPPISR